MTTIQIDSIHGIKVDKLPYNTEIEFHSRDGHTTKLVIKTTDAAYLTEKLLEIFPVGKEADADGGVQRQAT